MVGGRKNRVLKKVLRISSSKVLVIPKVWDEELPDYVWVSKEANKIVIEPAEVK